MFGIVALAALPEGTHAHHIEPPVVGPQGVRGVLADRTFARFLLASTAIAFVYFQSHTTFALQVRAHGFSNAAYGALIALNGLLVLLFELPVSSVTQHLRTRRVIAVGYALTGAGFAFTGVADSLGLLALAVLLWTLGEIASAPVASAYVADVAPPDRRGRYQGAFAMTLGLGSVLGPSVGTALFGWNPSGLWSACLLLGAAAALLVLRSPPAERPGAAAPAATGARGAAGDRLRR